MLKGCCAENNLKQKRTFDIGWTKKERKEWIKKKEWMNEWMNEQKMKREKE